MIEFHHKQKMLTHFHNTGAFLQAPPGKPFKLASGRESQFYIDCRKFLLTSKGVCLASAGFVNEIRRLLADCDNLPQAGPWVYVAAKGVGGLTLLGGILGHASAKMVPMRGLAVRDLPKDHGTCRSIEGMVEELTQLPQVPLVLVDDVLTSGGTAKSMIATIYEDLQQRLPVAMLFLVDREEGGMEQLQERFPHAKIRSMLTLSDLRSFKKAAA